MKLENAKITFLVSTEGTTIELRDSTAGVCFAKVTLTPEQLSSMLSRLSNTECECEVFGLDKVGKTQERKDFVFEIEETMRSSEKSKYLFAKATDVLISSGMEDWKSDSYFGSKDSFFSKDGNHYARTTIRRWV
jgi:hypothetical protein